MGWQEYTIVAVRIILPLVILRYQLAGGILAMLLDGADVIINEVIGGGSFGDHYHTLDKVLDSWYLAIELFVALRWHSPWARWPAIVLFVYRIIGVALFELTERRIVLFLFPNMFENLWLYCVAMERFWPRLYPHSVKTVAIPMLLLLIPKMGQEYLLHFSEAKPWQWFKRHVLDTT